jgi:diguanylate cyclase (GGDEF)-like protein
MLVKSTILTPPMSEPIRSETQLGLADLKKRFSAAGLPIIEQHRNASFQGPTYFVLGIAERKTDITIYDTFLDDLPLTKEYHTKVESYAAAVAGRIKCGSPEVFYCRSGIAIGVSIKWPILTAVSNLGPELFIIMDVVNQVDGQIAKCSMKIESSFGHTIFDIVPQTINSVRLAIDDGSIRFFTADVRQETYQRIKHQQKPFDIQSQPEIEKFLAGKAYLLGFLAVDEPGEIWAADPWDAKYLGVTKKELLLTMRVMRANALLDPGAGPEYVRPTDSLLAQQSAGNPNAEVIFQPQQQASRQNLPNKEVLLSNLQTVFERPSVSAILVIDLDHFKSVNDTQGHSEGDACLDRVVSTIANVVGRKGKLYRWGGDEFAVVLPDFSTEEAQVTAERIRAAVEQAKPGGEIVVTTSIGICGTDCTDSTSAEEILDFADKAMYESKRLGKNRVTIWPFVVANVPNPVNETNGVSQKAAVRRPRLSKGKFLQHLILKHALAIHSDRYGRPVSWGSLSNAIREAIPSLTDIEMHDALLFLDGRDYLRLQKFQGDVPNLTLVRHYEFPVKAEFFNGEFRLFVTPEGRVYSDELDSRSF